MENTIRIAGVIRESIVDGPGIRFTVFTQGCPHRCEGCHNPETHSFDGGYLCAVDKIMEEIGKNPLLSGVTVSGGDPFCQPEALLTLCTAVKKARLHLMIYTGYTYEQLIALNDDNILKILSLCDLLVDGKFILSQRDLTLKYRGSKNQRIIDVPKTLAGGRVVSAVP